jgi:molecular chaperone GrpE (heat shock protein)
MSEEEEAPEEIADDSTIEAEEDEGPPEDPEVTALKESIAELEATLADKKSKLQYELERCEEYSKSGYARKVADMENMKRVRSNIASTSQASATAAVLKDFLPMYDKFNTLKETYLENEFGQKFSALNLQATFETLGVAEFNVEAGDNVNNFRMKVLESEISTEQPKDTILRQVASGLELDGNVIRAALCVSSLGAEEEAAEESTEGEEGEAASE